MLCYALYDAPSKAVELVAKRIRESMRLTNSTKQMNFASFIYYGALNAILKERIPLS